MFFTLQFTVLQYYTTTWTCSVAKRDCSDDRQLCQLDACQFI